MGAQESWWPGLLGALQGGWDQGCLSGPGVGWGPASVSPLGLESLFPAFWCVEAHG